MLVSASTRGSETTILLPQRHNMQKQTTHAKDGYLIDKTHRPLSNHFLTLFCLDSSSPNPIDQRNRQLIVADISSFDDLMKKGGYEYSRATDEAKGAFPFFLKAESCKAFFSDACGCVECGTVTLCNNILEKS